MSFQNMFDAAGRAYERQYGQNPWTQPPPPAAPSSEIPRDPMPPVDPAVPSAYVAYAYTRRQGPGSNGGYHLVVDQPVHSGKLHRETGATLCPKRSFWGLEPRPEAEASCSPCIDTAERHGIVIRAPRKEEEGQ